MAGRLIWFVTPAWQRYELTAVCLEQRKRVIEELAVHGIEGQCVVIADDENLDIARAVGFDTVEQSNEGLGRKWNDGNVYAAERGADWIVPIGSDSWIDPAYFLPLPDPSRTRTSGMYTVVDANRLGECNVTSQRLSAGPYIFHRSILEPSGFRPTDDTNSRNTDHSTLAGIGHERIRWERKDMYPMQYVGFRQEPMMTPYEEVVSKWGIRESNDPWDRLADHYPADLVVRAREALGEAH